MAKITNTGTSEVLFRSRNGVDYKISAGDTVTVPDPEVTYDAVDSGIEQGYLTVTRDDDSPFFNQFGQILGAYEGSGAGGGGGGGSGDGLTDAQLRASPVPVSVPGTVTTTALTNTQLRATPVPVSGTVTTGGLTDTQLRATPVPVSGTVSTGGLTDTQLRASPLTVTTGGLTDTQLRATAVAISGTVTANGPLTNAQLRASTLNVRVIIDGAGNTSVDTSATGADFATFPIQSCARATVFNNTAVTIEVQQGGSGVAVPLSAGSFYTFNGINDVSQLGVRRVDVGTEVVTVQARWEF